MGALNVSAKMVGVINIAGNRCIMRNKIKSIHIRIPDVEQKLITGLADPLITNENGTGLRGGA